MGQRPERNAITLARTEKSAILYCRDNRSHNKILEGGGGFIVYFRFLNV